ncbi:MAG TPA: hypothetical protein VG294_09710 [Solirubrobacteraceae bacterium]|jgi:hypothetical protein|nr:hypothetical protein [Solirubrobacteraceae bacterium]
MRRRRGNVTALLLAAMLAGALAGCGSGELKPASGLNPSDQLLTQAAVENVAPGPVRALYQWWRYIQYNDRVDYLSMLTPALRAKDVQSRLFNYELPTSARELDAALPYVVSVSASGPRVTVYTTVAYHQLVGASRFITVQVPQAFTLTRLGSRWYIADDQFIVEQSRPSLIAAGVIPATVAGGAAKNRGPGAATTNPAATGQPSVRGGSATVTTGPPVKVTPTTTAVRPSSTTTTGPSTPSTTTTSGPGQHP